MLNAAGEVLYVGKAKSLKKRVTAYATGRVHSDRLTRMVADTAEMVFVTTASEIEALLLESNLIKRLKPRYNVSYRDDKSFPNILLREDHPYPQLAETSRRQDHQGRLFRALRLAPARSTAPSTPCSAPSCCAPVRTRCLKAAPGPCLLFQIKRCSAPCVNRIDLGGYHELVEEAESFLNGKSQVVQE